ncbi:MAG: alanine racemase [Pararhizobium sp.]
MASGLPDDRTPRTAAAGGRLTIDLGALRGNWRALCARAAAAETAAVVKADAYGIGIDRAVPALYDEGCRTFFVALAEEGIAVRRHAPDARIFVLNGFFPGSGALYSAARLCPVIGSRDTLAAWQSEGGDRYALQVDTGMNRLGLAVNDALSFAAAVREGSVAAPGMVMSHLACADTPAHPLNRRQLERFQIVAPAFDGIESSFANSAGIFLGPEYHFDLIRPGIALYGGEAIDGTANPMRPVVTLEGRIAALRTVGAGETVSYGATRRLDRETVIATCAVGYGDGYPRALSGSGVPLRGAGDQGASGFVAGRQVPLIGRVTMDLTMFDVTDCGADVAVGDFIELVGPNMPLDDVARAAGTIGYELLTSLGRRYDRRFTG